MHMVEIWKKSWQLLVKSPYLYFIGILASFCIYGGGLRTSFSPTSSTSLLIWETRWTTWAGAHFDQAWLIILVVMVAMIILITLGLSLSAGQIIATAHDDQESKPMGSKVALKKGRPFAGRLFGVLVIAGMIVILFLIAGAIAANFLYSAFDSKAAVIRALLAFIGYLLILGLVVLAVYWVMVINLTQRIIVLTNGKILASLEKAQQLVKKTRRLVWLLAIGAVIISVLSMAMAESLTWLVSKLYGSVPRDGAHLATVVAFWIIAELIFIIVNGLFSTYASVYWTMTYIKLDKNK